MPCEPSWRCTPMCSVCIECVLLHTRIHTYTNTKVKQNGLPRGLWVCVPVGFCVCGMIVSACMLVCLTNSHTQVKIKSLVDVIIAAAQVCVCVPVCLFLSVHTYTQCPGMFTTHTHVRKHVRKHTHTHTHTNVGRLS